jgi:hypothetical protein
MSPIINRKLINLRRRSLVKIIVFTAIVLFVLDFGWNFKSNVEHLELSENDVPHIKSMFESLTDNFFGPDNKMYEQKNESYNVKKKMYVEMGLRSIERRIFGWQNNTMHGYIGDRTGMYQFVPPPKILLEVPATSYVFVKPTNIFGKEDLGENGEGVEMPQNLTLEIQKVHDEGKIK